MTSFTELEVFSCLSFNILNEDLSGKVDKISTILAKIIGTTGVLLIRTSNLFL